MASRSIGSGLIGKVLIVMTSTYRAVAILVLNGLVALACFELVAIGYFNLNHSRTQPGVAMQLVGEGAPRETVSYYASQDWAERFWYEFRLSRTQQFRPFVGWRRAPFKGQTIEVDQNGVRVTPGANCSPNSFKVFTFGASEMWGTGSPNWGTIPAHLQKGLETLREGPVCVMNFAESAYVSMQGVITLLMQLRSGNVPDVVLFYSVEDDIYSAYQSGRVGVLENLDQIAARFEEKRKPEGLLDRVKATYSYKLVDLYMDKLTIAKPQEAGANKVVNYESLGIDVGTLSDAVVQELLENYKVLSGLAQEYGFKYMFVVPPSVWRGEKSLTPEEQRMKEVALQEEALHRLSAAVYRKLEVESVKYENFHSLTHVFDHYDALLWIDATHVTPDGNQLIATSLLELLQGRKVVTSSCCAAGDGGMR